MDQTFQALIEFWEDVKIFFRELSQFIIKSLHLSFLNIEKKKGVVVTALYQKRGKLSRTLSHSGMAAIAALGVMIAPLIAQDFPGQSVNPWSISAAPSVLSASTDTPVIDTQISQKVRDITTYVVQDGDTVASIANKFGISQDTVRWANNLSGDKIETGDLLKILPVTGVAHTVVKGDTVYSIANKYDAEAQAIVDFPFNTFTNDETFELAIGQTVIVPDGVMPTGVAATPRARQMTPDAGTVTASGQFVWPTQGIITQYFSWYHPAIDIANPAEPLDVAADSGVVIHAGWDTTGYGNMVMIDHQNGFKTLYGHLSVISVVIGQHVNKGDVIGRMGSDGHSTGPHTHFEIYENGVRVNPLLFLK